MALVARESGPDNSPMKRGIGSLAFATAVVLAGGCGSTGIGEAPGSGPTDRSSPVTSVRPTSIPSGPTTPSGRIAYVLGPDGDRELHVVDADGTDDRSCGTGAAPAWSADGSTIVFERLAPLAADGIELPDVYRATADCTGAVKVIADGSAPHLSPDGASLTFGRGIIDTGDAWIARSDGLMSMKLMTGTSPTWSPDGSWLLLNPAGGAVELGLIRPDGTGYHSLGGGHDPSWTPDGRIVYLRSDYPQATTTVRVIGLDGTAIDLVTGLGELASPRMLSDGRVIFVWNGDVWRIDPGSPEPVRLTDGLMAISGPSPSADGRWAAVAVDGNEPGLVAVSTDGGQVPVLRGAVSDGIWQPGG